MTPINSSINTAMRQQLPFPVVLNNIEALEQFMMTDLLNSRKTKKLSNYK